jgi:hypothetical protein
LTRSLAAPAASPIAKAPPYHRGFSQDGELGEPLPRPREVLLLLAGRLRELRADRGIARGQRLRGVERLGADLARVVDAHEAGRVPPRRGIELRLGDVRARRRPRRGRVPAQRAQRAVESDYEVVYHRSILAHGARTQPRRSCKKKRAPGGARVITSNLLLLRGYCGLPDS